MRRLVLVAIVIAGCGPDGSSDGAGAGGGGAGGGGAGSPVEGCGNGWDDDGDGRIDEECACAPGTTQACWPGTPDERQTGECRDGVQTCVGDDEFTEWGPCEGAVMPVPDELADGIDQDCSGGDGGSTGGDGECHETCAPGSSRWCDTPTDCTWGTQMCNPDGTWGTCTETATPEPCREPPEDIFGIPSSYDTDCCLSLPSACCQNYPDVASVGECAGVTTCTP